MKTFNPEAAARDMQERWTESLLEAGFRPLFDMVDSLEEAFARVKMAKRSPKNKVKVFRFKHPERAKEYERLIRAATTCIFYLQDTVESVLELLAAAYPAYFKAVRGRVMEALMRWKNVLPANLVGRDEESIVLYANLVKEATDACALDMLICEEMIEELHRRR